MSWSWGVAETACMALLVLVAAGLWVNATFRIRAFRRGDKIVVICPRCGHQYTAATVRLRPGDDREER